MEGIIPKEVIEDIRLKNDIVSVISKYIDLKKAGKNYKGLCPFHGEKEPSFFVSPEKQLFYCFGCHEGGNVFNFIMKIDNLTFPEACEFLAEQAGIKIPDSKVEKPGYIKEKERIKELNNLSAHFYHKILMKSTKAEEARRYLKNRGVKKETIKSFTLGFAPEGWDYLANFLLKKGFNEELLLKAGLCNESSKGKKIYDRFRNRIIYPIKDKRGDVLGFGGRVLSEKVHPKYLNSPQTPVFNKRGILYGMDLSIKQVRETESAIIVEGYMDTIMLYQFGFENVLAPLGTSFTEAQGRILKYNVKNVYILFDADAAGEAATLRSLELLQDMGLVVKVCQLPGEMDPDDYLNEFGPDRFQNEIMQEAMPLAYYCLRQAAANKDFGSIEDKKEFVSEAIPVIAKLKSPVEQEEYLKLIANWLKTEKNIIEREFNRYISLKNRSSREKGKDRWENIGSKKKKDKLREYRKDKGQLRAQEELITLMLNNFDVVPLVKKYLFPEEFSKKEWSIIVYRLYQLESQGENDFDLPLMMSSIVENNGEKKENKEDLEKEITRLTLLEVPKPENTEKMVKDCAFKIKGNNIKKRKSELQEMLKKIDPQEDYDKYKELLSELQKHIKMEKEKTLDLEEGGYKE